MVSSACACSSETSGLSRADREEIVSRAAGLRVVVCGSQISVSAGELEARRHHADDRPRSVAHTNRPLQHVGVAAEAALPVRMADQRWPAARSGHRFFGRERAADDRLDREDAKELAHPRWRLARTPPRRPASPGIRRRGSWTSPRTTSSGRASPESWRSRPCVWVPPA